MNQCIYTVCTLDEDGNHSPLCPVINEEQRKLYRIDGEPLTIEAQWQPSQRDYFAAHAMQGILARSLVEGAKLSPNIQGVTGLLHNYGMKRTHYPIPVFNKHGDKIEPYGEFVAREAFAFADIMIAASAMVEGEK